LILYSNIPLLLLYIICYNYVPVEDLPRNIACEWVENN
jgi:hypothetical protein